MKVEQEDMDNAKKASITIKKLLDILETGIDDDDNNERIKSILLIFLIHQYIECQLLSDVVMVAAGQYKEKGFENVH